MRGETWRGEEEKKKKKEDETEERRMEQPVEQEQVYTGTMPAEESMTHSSIGIFGAYFE